MPCAVALRGTDIGASGKSLGAPPSHVYWSSDESSLGGIFTALLLDMVNGRT